MGVTGANTEGDYLRLHFFNEKLYLGTGITNLRATTAVYQDPSAWYHVVAALDTTQATAANRVKLYVNGVEVTAFDANSNPAQNADLAFNKAVLHEIGSVATSVFLNGYLADIHFIDGQALTPTSFGETDANGIWQPKAYTGTYGTNGFHLDFADNASTTTIGYDAAGSNDWTANNLSVTAGSGNDSLVDVPTNGAQTDTGAGGEVRGNYCTWNPLKLSAGYTLANGNLDVSGNGANLGAVGTVGVSSGKWYWEIVVTSGANDDMAALALTSNTSASADDYAGSTATNGWGWRQDGSVLKNAANITINNIPADYTDNDVLQIAIDADAGKVWLGKNGTWTASGNPAAGTTQTITYAASEAPYFPVTRPYEGSSVANFGQRPFAYAAPSGFKALCTANIPEGTITTSGTFTGNANTDGPFVYLNGVPTAMTINGNAVTFATHADKLSNGFKVRSSSSSYNTSGSNTYSVTTTGAKFKVARAQPNP
jgi:hypothetical protein